MRSDLKRNYNSVGSGHITVSLSEFVEAHKVREAKHAEYEKLAEESALKRKMLEQEIEERYYKSNLVNQVVFHATPMLKASFAAQRKAGLERSQEEAVVQSAVRLALVHLPICRGHRTCLDTKGYSIFIRYKPGERQCCCLEN